jgi:cell division protein FtsL
MPSHAAGPRRSLWPRVVVAIILCFVGMMLYVWKNVRVSQLAREVAALQKEKELLVNENRSLAMTMTSLLEMARIEQIARDELKLQYPESYPVVFKVADGTSRPQGAAKWSLRRLGSLVKQTRETVVPSAEAEWLNRE